MANVLSNKAIFLAAVLVFCCIFGAKADLNSGAEDGNDHLDSLDSSAGSQTTEHKDETVNSLPKIVTTTAEPLVLDPSQQLIANASSSPRSDKQKVLEAFHKFFLRSRSHDDQAQKEFVRDGIILRLRELGFETSFLQKSRFEFRRKPAFSYNMISILPGRHRQTSLDRIVLIGAHWDSYTKAPVSRTTL